MRNYSAAATMNDMAKSSGTPSGQDRIDSALVRHVTQTEPVVLCHTARPPGTGGPLP